MNTDKTYGAEPTLARKTIASSSSIEAQQVAIAEGVRRIEDIIKGRTAGLIESQFLAALG